MQKAKKMSKQTLVIAVLAVLLVLSLALSVTGAWFTDKDHAESSTKIQFAKVAVEASAITSTATTVGREQSGTTLTNVLPGDSIALEGSVNSTGSTVRIYLGLAISDIKITGTHAGGTVDLTSVLANYVDISELTVAANAAATDKTTAAASSVLDKVYEINGEATLSYTGGITFIGQPTTEQTAAGKLSLPNYVESGSVAYALNVEAYDVPEGATVITELEVTASIIVVGIQADNIEFANAVTELEALVA